MTERREFLKQGLLIGGGLLFNSSIVKALSVEENLKLTILHTNDWHSRIDPFPMDGSKNQGLGGAAKRAALIKKIREEEEHVLLVDSGDMFQGTPYFNMYGGELEFKLMSEMGYEAVTLGNHDFDAGLGGLAKQLPHAKFDIISSNYDFSETELAEKFIPYKIINKGKLKLGILGVGIELTGLVPAHQYGNTKYLEPIERINHYAALLKNEHKCHFVICLSHLGYKYESEKVSDFTIAKQTTDVDLILGGHTHTFLNSPTEVINKSGKPVLINQAGWGGMILGRLDFNFSNRGTMKNSRSSSVKLS